MYTSESGFQLKLNRTGTDVKRLIVQAAGPLRLQMQQKTYLGDFKAFNRMSLGLWISEFRMAVKSTI